MVSGEKHGRSTPVEWSVMHQSFETIAPDLQERVRDSRAKVGGNYFLIVHAVQGK